MSLAPPAAWSEREEMEFRLGQAEADLFLLRAQLRRSLAESEDLEALLVRVLESLPQGIVLTDLEGRVRSLNRAAEDLAGLSRDRLAGRPYDECFPGRPTPADRLRAGDVAPGTWRLSTSRGERVVETRVRWIHGARGEISGAVELWTDRSDDERVARELEETRGLAAMGRLAAVAAHEIRNPLGGIAGFLDLLERSLRPEDARRSHTGRIREGVQALEALVAEFLEFTRPAAPGKDAIDLVELARAAAADLGDTAAKHGVTLRVRAPRGAAAACAGSRERLLRAASNLVRNAIEASPRGGVVELAAAGGDRPSLSVRDSGPGVDPALAPRIFEPFVTGKARGTGLGLALVSRAAELHGGRVTHRNRKSGGAEFRLELPAMKEECA